MILFPLAAVGTGGPRLLDDGLKMSVVHVAEHLGKIPAGPEFIARRVGAADRFEGGGLPATFGGVGRALVAGLWYLAHCFSFMSFYVRSPMLESISGSVL
jgi:hypothetical protein